MRRSKDPQRAHFADPLRAAFRTNRDFFPPLYRSYARARAPVKRYFLFVSIRKVLYSASSGSSLWARILRGQNQRQRPITNGLLPTSSKCSDSMSTNCT